MQHVLKDIGDFHQSRWARQKAPLEVVVEIDEDEDFTVRMNRGKFQQIVDNLIFNSEYWLKEDIRTGRIDRGLISISADPPYLRVSDNGMGISQNVESSLFEPFVTAKPPEEGRGLGLFIVRQLLSSEGCEIALMC